MAVPAVHILGKIIDRESVGENEIAEVGMQNHVNDQRINDHQGPYPGYASDHKISDVWIFEQLG